MHISINPIRTHRPLVQGHADEPINRQPAAAHAAALRATQDPRPQGPRQWPQPLSRLGLWQPIVRAWITENGGWFAHDRRSDVIRRIDEFFLHSRMPPGSTTPDQSGLLRLNGLELTSLPPLFPPGVSRLDLSFNRLGVLPNNLSSRLTQLRVAHNQLGELPNSLPRSLRELDVSHNQLTSLPDHLPPHLQVLSVRHNQLTNLSPEAIHRLGQLDRTATVDLRDNPLSRQTIDDLNQLRSALADRGPQIYYPSGPEPMPIARHWFDAQPHPVPARDVGSFLEGTELRLMQQSAAAGAANPPNDWEFINTRLEHLAIARPLLDAQAAREMGVAQVLVDLLPDQPDQAEPATRAVQAAEQAAALADAAQEAESQLSALAILAEQAAPQAAIAERAQRAAQALHTLFAAQEAYIHGAQGVEQGGAQGAQGEGVQRVQVQAVEEVQARMLSGSVAAWMPPPQTGIAATSRLWAGFAAEPGATAFARFLNRLRDTVNFSNPQFQRGVVRWLSHLEANPRLRSETFALSEGATATCEDRVSHTFNAMRQLHLASDVARGTFDQRLPQLLNVARGMFRLDQLEIIAREHAAATPGVDQIEVYLAYQVMLRQRLALPLDTADMRYAGLSGVTSAHLDRAQARVLDAERRGFANYLSSDWQPWQAVLQRLAPEQHAQAQGELIDAMGDEFSNRLTARLHEAGLENDSDAQRIVGPQVQAEIAHEINGRVTRDFLASRGLAADLRETAWA